MAPNNSRKKKTFINTIAGVINSFCNSILSFVLRTIFIITLGIQYTGVSSVFTAILTMLSLSELGIGTAIATALYSPLKEQDEKTIQKLMHFYKTAYRNIAVFIFIIGLSLTPFLEHIITKVPDVKENIRIIFMFYIVRNALSYLMIYKSTLLNADQKQYITKSYETLCTLVRYALEIIFLLVFKDFIIYLVIEVLGTITQNYLITKRAEKEYPYAFKDTPERLTEEEKRLLFKDIKGLAMYSISGSLGKSIDSVLISSYIATAMAGLLSNYTLIKQQIERTIKQFFNALTPSVGNLAAEHDTIKQIRIFEEILYISFVLVNFCSVCMFVLFNPFINAWLGEEYCLDNEIAFIIAFDFFLYIFLQAIASFRTANGLFVKGQYRPLLTAVLNVILSLTLIKTLGIFGTILATVICRFVTQWYDPYLLYKYIFHYSFRNFCLKYSYYILLFVVNCSITYYATQSIDVTNKWGCFFLKCGICIIVSNIVALIFSCKMHEFSYLYKLFKKYISNHERTIRKTFL